MGTIVGSGQGVQAAGGLGVSALGRLGGIGVWDLELMVFM